MKSYLFIVIILLSVISNNVNANNFDNRINNIIDRHYSKLIKSLKTQNLELRDFQEDISKQEIPTPMKGYECDHDKIQTQPTAAQMQAYKKLHDDLMISQGASAHDNSRLRQVSEADEVGNIRINFDTTKFSSNNDANYACYSVGQVVTVNTDYDPSATLPACSDTSASPCRYTCTVNDILDSSLANLITQSIIGAIDEILTEFITVDRIQGNLILQADLQCHYGLYTPATVQSPGLANTDYYVMATLRPSKSSGTIASAKACIFPNNGVYVTGRPVAGMINFSPRYFRNFISNPAGLTFREFTRVGLHEFVHALGFSSFFYPSYTNSAGQRYSTVPGQAVTYSGTTPAGVPFNNGVRNYFNTPTVMAFGKAHYNCQSYKGQELENAGGGGTAGSHWEKRQTGEELMLGFIQPSMPLTRLTLSLLQDSGWYGVEFDMAEQLLWGKKLGCAWNSGCTATSWNFPGMWCSSQNVVTGCSPTRAGKGACKVVSYGQSLAPANQHFVDPTLGGVDDIADYCPFYSETEYCQDESKQSSANTQIGETYSLTSKCFEFTFSNDDGMACLSQRCSATNVLEIQVAGTWYQCPNSTSSIVANGYTVPCPSYFYPCEDTIIPNTTTTTTPTSSSPSSSTTSPSSSDVSISTSIYSNLSLLSLLIILILTLLV
ncbi:hypothetical protein DLAC_06775 [Tieghemostelium lacteum]|uniref:Peptidase M8 n=1 Tax=Tieghemostelium lacteum TaxID=361077 RepID=A0A151ZEB5_TIELA|nr:hypothetical protein DLAC_06775 [Tieghemostelium lacteum]|eukprot:KYQ92291.1 hypothetical protein DLAC_06775 [Tieghemostelium lacteum]